MKRLHAFCSDSRLLYVNVTMKDQDNVCRVCSAQDGILLDLFGPQPQSRSYAADVIKCLSVEVCSMILSL